MLRNLGIWCSIRIQPIIDIENVCKLLYNIKDECDYITVEHLRIIYDTEQSIKAFWKLCENKEDFELTPHHLQVKRAVKIRNIKRIKEIAQVPIGVGDNDLHYLSQIFDTYVSLLRQSNIILQPLFDDVSGTYYEDSKIELLRTLLEGYDEYTLEKIYNELVEGNNDTNAIKYKLYLEQNSNTAKEIFINLITYNSLSSNSTYLNWVNKMIKKYDFDELLDDEKELDSTFTKTSNRFNTISSLSGYKYTPMSGTQGDTTQKIFIV